jgi:hypothetical protein
LTGRSSAMPHIATFLIALATTVLIGAGGLFALQSLDTANLLMSFGLILLAGVLTLFTARFLRG